MEVAKTVQMANRSFDGEEMIKGQGDEFRLLFTIHS